MVSTELIQTIFQQVTLPMLVVDAVGQVMLTNPAAIDLLGLQQGQLLAEIEHGDRLMTTLNELKQNPALSTAEMHWPDSRIFQVLANKLEAGGLAITLHDITRLREMDEVKSIFVETVSHDLKNPLSTIHGYATLLGMENLSTRGRANLEGLLQGVEQIQSLIQNLLDLARIESRADGQIEPCDLAEITTEVVSNFELQVAEKEISLQTDLPEGLFCVAGNPLRLSQVVSNLISNAVKYTPKGGQIAIRIHQQEDQIHLQVADNGPGILPDEQSKIFQKFYRVPTMENGEWIDGTGLGLSIVKAIVEGYGGSIILESQMGVGSTFHCFLPAIEEA
jgi:two-component system phosphate regulon sensor histidine kinase PhoR